MCSNVRCDREKNLPVDLNTPLHKVVMGFCFPMEHRVEEMTSIISEHSLRPKKPNPGLPSKKT